MITPVDLPKILPKVLEELPSKPLIHTGGPLIFVGGGMPDLSRFEDWLSRYPVLAVDGGARFALAAGLRPIAVVGDMDSFSEDAFTDYPEQNCPIVKITDQLTTDFEKALAVTEAPLILGFGFLGGRLDHSLAAMHALANSRSSVVLIGEHDAMMFCRQQVELSLPAGGRISIWPLVSQQFKSSQGLVWPLDGLTLKAGEYIGTSNQVINDKNSAGRDLQDVVITPESGGSGFMVIVDADAGESLIDSVQPSSP